jgi:magnesium transporter
MEDNHPEKSKEIKFILVNGSLPQIRTLISRTHEADVADALEELSHEQRIHFFRKVKPELAAEIFEEIEQDVQVEVIQEVMPSKATQLLDSMDLDDATDLIQDLQEEDYKKAADIIRSLKLRKEVESLLKYPENSAGGIMNPAFIAIPENLTVKEALKLFKKAEPPEKDFSYYIYIVNEAGQLKGVTDLRDLVCSSGSKKVNELRKENLITVHVEMDQEKVAHIISKYDFLAVPVVDDAHNMLGIVTVDDIVDVLKDEATEDILKLSGTGTMDEDELLSGSIIKAAKSRFQWLFLTFFGGLLSGAILSLFAHTYGEKPLFLAIVLGFVPLLVGLGGNVGNQSATIMVRGLAAGYIREFNVSKRILREMMIGLLLGLGIGGLVLIGTFLFYHTWSYGVVIVVAILINLLFSCTIGTLLPFLFNKIGIDPAVASAPFISSTIDVVGLLIYFTVLSFSLNYITFPTW